MHCWMEEASLANLSTVALQSSPQAVAGAVRQTSSAVSSHSWTPEESLALSEPPPERGGAHLAIFLWV